MAIRVPRLGPGVYGPGSGLAGYGIDESDVFVVGWMDEAPPYVQVEGDPVLERTTALLIAELDFDIGSSGEIHLPTGTIPGTLISSSQEANWCGMRATNAYLPGGEVVFEYRLPSELISIDLPSLHFNLETDGPRAQSYHLEFLDWTSGEWLEIEMARFGLNVIGDAERLISQEGIIQARLSVDDNSWGCWSLDVGIDGYRPNS